MANLANTLEIMAMENLGVQARDFSTKTRKKMAKKGTAEPDGSYPIKNAKDVSNAVKDFHRSSGSPADKAHIRNRAKSIGMKDPFKKDVAAGGPGSGRKPTGKKSPEYKHHELMFRRHRDTMMKMERGVVTGKNSWTGFHEHIDAAVAHDSASTAYAKNKSTAPALGDKANSLSRVANSLYKTRRSQYEDLM